ncbi:MAG: ACT domain-containing protein [Lachnospiraceae bacterium]|nr:ACT domain-containing protein [Lachnospiraceae bacterium]
MSIKQISVFIENKKGELAEVTRYIANHDINIKALSIADTQDFGILRIICEDSAKVETVLREGGYLITVTDVLAAAIADEPGSMAAILEVLYKAHIMVEYTYAFVGAKEGAYMIFRVDDNAKAIEALTAAGIKTADQDELF